MFDVINVTAVCAEEVPSDLGDRTAIGRVTLFRDIKAVAAVNASGNRQSAD